MRWPSHAFQIVVCLLLVNGGAQTTETPREQNDQQIETTIAPLDTNSTVTAAPEPSDDEIVAPDIQRDVGVESREFYNYTSEDLEPSLYSPTDEEDESNLIQQWEMHMQGFIPEMLVTFSLGARSDEYFYEDVGSEPVLVRGGYFVSADEDKSDVDFQVTDPSGEVVWHKTKAEGLFFFNTTMAGSYAFIVSNHRWMVPKVVTFALGKGNDNNLQPEHLTTVEDHIHKVDRLLRDIQSEAGYLWIRQKTHYLTVQTTKQRVFWFTVLELVVTIGISAFQVYYVKALLSDRRMV